MKSRIAAALLSALALAGICPGGEVTSGDAPSYVELDRGEEARYILADKTAVTVSLLDYSKTSARVKVNGKTMTFACGPFVKPRVVSGARLALEVTRAWSDRKRWKSFGLRKDVRLFLSDASKPVVSSPSLVYPLRPAPKLENGRSGGWLERRRPSSKDCHIGFDTYGPMGTEVVSVEAGKAVTIETDPYQSKGRYVIVRGKRFKCTYIHLATVEVKPGQQVAAGERLGMMGQSGWVKPHLHFQLSPAGPAGDVNPQHYMYDMFNRLKAKPTRLVYRVNMSFVDRAGAPVKYAELFLKMPDGSLLPCDRTRATAVTAGTYTFVATQKKLGLRGETTATIKGNASVKVVLEPVADEQDKR